MMEKCKFCGSDPVYHSRTFVDKTIIRQVECMNPECGAKTAEYTTVGPSIESVKLAHFAWSSGNYTRPQDETEEEEETDETPSET